jgi:spore coat protein U-like protein
MSAGTGKKSMGVPVLVHALQTDQPNRMHRRFTMKKSTKIAICLVLPLSGAMFAQAAMSATTGTVVPVSATVIDSCTVSAAPLAFGNYNGLSATSLDATATIAPFCTNGTPYTVALDVGLGAGATLAARNLTGPDSATLTYGIFTDATYTNVWGDGTGGTGVGSGTGNGAPQSLTMYARIPALQTSTVGMYSDQLTVTLSY